jgi:hypothetical protein
LKPYTLFLYRTGSVGPEGEGEAAMVMLCLTYVAAAGILVYGELPPVPASSSLPQYTFLFLQICAYSEECDAGHPSRAPPSPSLANPAMNLFVFC